MLIRALIDDGDIDLIYKSEFANLRIVNLRNITINKTFKAPNDGWNKDHLQKFDAKAHEIYPVFDLYLGNIWIGSSHID